MIFGILGSQNADDIVETIDELLRVLLLGYDTD